MGISNRKEPFPQDLGQGHLFPRSLFVLIQSDDFKIPLINKYSCSPSVCARPYSRHCTESREQNQEFCPCGTCTLVQEMSTSIYTFKSVGDKYHGKGNRGEKSYRSAWQGEGQGCSVDMTFRKKLKEECRLSDDSSSCL